MKKYRVYSIKGSPGYVIAENRKEAFKMLESDLPYRAVEVPLEEKESIIKFFKMSYEHKIIKAFADYGDFDIEYTCNIDGDFVNEGVKLSLKNGESTYCRVKLYLLCEYNDYDGRFDETNTFVYLRNIGYNPYNVIETLIERIMLEISAKKVLYN